MTVRAIENSQNQRVPDLYIQRHGNCADDSLEVLKQNKDTNLESDLNDANESLPGGDITVPGKSTPNDGKKIENASPRGGKYYLRPTPNYTEK